MNTRIDQIVTRLGGLLEKLFTRQPQSSASLPFRPRHAEQLAAAGFGFSSMHDYRSATKAGSERCRGYYIPDSAMIELRMSELGYPPNVVRACVELFAQAVSNGDGSTRATLVDDLRGERLRVSDSDELANHSLLMETLKYDILSEESSLWPTLARFGIGYDGETEENVHVSINLAPDIPSLHHLGQIIEVRFDAIYDLDQGEDTEALFYKTNRQLGLRGNLRLKPSGKRGWAYPTIRMEETPFIDDRTPAEMQGEYAIHAAPNIDEQQFDDGADAGLADLQPASHASSDFLAGWIMTANGVNGRGHMSTGQIDKAFYGALANARTLDVHDAHYLAAQACRYLVSSRARRALEELIQENATVEEW
jgi:hypothetical protein